MRYRLIITPVLLVAVWGACTWSGLVQPLFLPPPEHVAQALWSGLMNGRIPADMGQTLHWTLWAFGIGAVVGIPLGIAMGYWRLAGDLLEIPVDFFRSLPVIVLFPLFMVVFGIGHQAKVATGAFAAVLITIIGTAHGVRHCRLTRQQMARSFGATPWQVFSRVIFWDALPEIVTALRTSLSMALIIVVITEMFFGTEVGLGRRIFDSSLLYRMPEMYANIIVVGLLGYGLNKVLHLAERRSVHWGGR